MSRLNIAGPDGIRRLVFAHEMPQAPFQGIELPRSVPPGLAGLIYCAPNGDEAGGIGVSGSDRSGHSLITLDYRDTPLEAIGIATEKGPNGQSAQLVVMDPPRSTVDVRKLRDKDPDEIQRLQAMMIERVSLGVDHDHAGLVIRDRNGRERIVLRVGTDGEP